MGVSGRSGEKHEVPGNVIIVLLSYLLIPFLLFREEPGL